MKKTIRIICLSILFGGCAKPAPALQALNDAAEALGGKMRIQQLKTLAIEGEGEGPSAIDGAASWQASAGQDAGLAKASLATTALVAVSRIIANISMQVRCSQISRVSPFGLALNQR